MWNLGEYRKHPQRLADHLPWATLIAPGVMLNKDGSLQKTIAFRGPDLDSSTPYELVAARARMNNVLRRLGSHWCVHVEASRRLAHVYPASDFPNPVAAMIDQERRDSFTADALHFESQCFITFTYLPPAEGMTRLGDFFIDRPNNKVDGRVSYRAHFDHFLGQVDQIVNLMASFMPEVHPLDDGETLTYLHSCISDRRLKVAVPDVPFYLDEMITDRPLAGGLSPRLGRLFLKTVSVRAYVNRTLPCLLDRLNELPIEYRWIGRYLPMDKTDATRQLNKLRRQWFAKRKGMVTLLKEAITKQESKLEDSDSLNKSEDVDDALQELGGDHCSFGDFTLTITVWDEDEQTATEKARAVQQVVDGVGLVTEIEDFNAVQAWMGSLPGHAYADVRRPLVSSLNVCDLVPLSAVWSGPARCAPPERSAAACNAHEGLNAIPIVSASRRCRSHDHCRSHRRGQIDAFESPGLPMAALSRRSRLHLRQRRKLPGHDVGDGRRFLRPGRRRRRDLLPAASPGSTTNRNWPGRRIGSRTFCTAKRRKSPRRPNRSFGPRCPTWLRCRACSARSARSSVWFKMPMFGKRCGVTRSTDRTGDCWMRIMTPWATVTWSAVPAGRRSRWNT